MNISKILIDDIQLLTVKAADGRTPPPAICVIPPWIASGCGTPNGGNIGNGGGTKAATANTPTDAIAPSSIRVSSSSSIVISIPPILSFLFEHVHL